VSPRTVQSNVVVFRRKVFLTSYAGRLHYLSLDSLLLRVHICTHLNLARSRRDPCPWCLPASCTCRLDLVRHHIFWSLYTYLNY
jgi:hypothetical protein